ncbi:hypothetical protein MMC17_008013 [Xylographa soralifera]|nr:hypothetical protein [Xylographa soralifera]
MDLVRESYECSCDVCKRLDIHETVNRAALTSFPDAHCDRKTFDYFDISINLPQQLEDIHCPLRAFLAGFFSEDLNSRSISYECFYRLEKCSEEELIWHWSQFPQGILRTILSVQLMDLSQTPDPILLGLDECSDTNSQGWFGTETVNPTIDFDLMKECLQYCETEHQRCRCTGDPTKHPYRVIDIESHLIVPSPEGCRYLALSYVWGPRDDCDPKTTFEIREIHDSASKEILGHIPQAIANAMDVARNLGERYLWVDALCIDRTNAPEEHSEIQNMNHIYNQAIATIILLDGNSFDYVPGTESRPRTGKRCAILHGHKFRELTPNFMDCVRDPMWATRAWTRQEGMLSHRCLVVSGHEATFICRESCISESNRLSRTGDAIGRLPAAERAQIGRGMHNDFFARSIKGSFLYDYIQVIGDYSKRQLTYPSDALNAIRGILRDYESQLDARFLWGLPVDQFQEALSWCPFNHRSIPVQCRRPNFPSWSWTSYSGPVSFIYSAMSYCQRYQFLVPVVENMHYLTDISDANADDLLEMEYQPVLTFYALGLDVDVLLNERDGCCPLSTRSKGQRVAKIMLDVMDD